MFVWYECSDMFCVLLFVRITKSCKHVMSHVQEVATYVSYPYACAVLIGGVRHSRWTPMCMCSNHCGNDDIVALLPNAVPRRDLGVPLVVVGATGGGRPVDVIRIRVD
jgi:hypothetical protein